MAVVMQHIARSPQQVGAVLHRLRKEKGWTQAQLAQRAGVRQELVSKIESGQEGTRLATIFALLAALELEFLIQPRSTFRAEDFEDIF
jgi:HTH-type transcriptional regulator/antitoxin HipB